MYIFFIKLEERPSWAEIAFILVSRDACFKHDVVNMFKTVLNICLKGPGLNRIMF